MNNTIFATSGGTIHLWNVLPEFIMIENCHLEYKLFVIPYGFDASRQKYINNAIETTISKVLKFNTPFSYLLCFVNNFPKYYTNYPKFTGGDGGIPSLLFKISNLLSFETFIFMKGILLKKSMLEPGLTACRASTLLGSNPGLRN